MIDKVEVGKKYRLINKEGWLTYGDNSQYNTGLIKRGVFDSDGCVVIDKVHHVNYGFVGGNVVISAKEFPFFELVEENTKSEEPKIITPETEVTITTTYGELAKVYYVMGNVIDKKCSRMLWATVADILGDSNRSIYRENVPNNPMIDYRPVQKEWESLFFKSKEQQEKEVVIKQKRDMIAKLEKEIKELGG